MQTTQTNLSRESGDTSQSGELSNLTTCEVCHGFGWVYCNVPIGHTLYGQAMPCNCRRDILRQEKLQVLLRYCELPPMSESMTFERFKVYPEVKEAFDVAKQVASSSSEISWVTFTGINDTGKTHLAVAICREWINQGVSAKYIFVPLLLDELREGFKQSGNDSYEERFKRFCTVPLLILDDLGAQSNTVWVNEKLETLVDYRLMHNLSLIVTTNKNIDELSPRMGSRLIRHPKAVVVQVGREEYTLRKTRNKKDNNSFGDKEGE